MNEKDIDFVITWLDPADPEWQQQYKKIAETGKYCHVADFSPERYRDWANLKYWFRGVEKHAPWVNKIHFVTYGHLPDWLNSEHEKLNIVRHSDYIDAKNLPTFNSRTLELSLVKLEELAEQFVIFNDDFFIIDDLPPSVFFKKGLPCDFAVLNASSGGDLSPILMNNLALINDVFDKKHSFKKHFSKWININYKRHLSRTLLLLPWPRFTGFIEPHLPQPYLKSNFQETWRLFEKALTDTCQSRFRLLNNVNHYLFRYHHLVTGKFHPVEPYANGTYYQVSDENCANIAAFIRERRKPLITINDAPMDDFETAKSVINSSLDSILPEKSSFER